MSTPMQPMQQMQPIMQPPPWQQNQQMYQQQQQFMQMPPNQPYPSSSKMDASAISSQQRGSPVNNSNIPPNEQAFPMHKISSSKNSDKTDSWQSIPSDSSIKRRFSTAHANNTNNTNGRTPVQANGPELVEVDPIEKPMKRKRRRCCAMTPCQAWCCGITTLIILTVIGVLIWLYFPRYVSI
jgi:hypothetical protein